MYNLRLFGTGNNNSAAVTKIAGTPYVHSAAGKTRTCTCIDTIAANSGKFEPTERSSRKSFWLSPTGKTIGLAAGTLLFAGVGAFLYGTMIETRQYRLETIDIATGGAGRYKEGNGRVPRRKLRILHLSDLHLDGDDDEKAEFLRRVTDDDYDIVVLTGDIFERYSGIKYVSSLLSRKPRIGAFAVLGNHDYFNYSPFNKTIGRIFRRFRHGERRDVTPMVTALKEVGFTVLQNQARSVPEHELFVVGIDWPSISEDKLQALVAQAPEDHFMLCLVHMPINLKDIERAGFDLAVGGHTHGGQVRIPGFGAMITDSELARHEASGLTWRGKTAFHISRGLGADPQSNIRFFCPPAVTVLNVTHYESVKSILS